MDHAIETREKRPTFMKAIVFVLVMILIGAGLAAFALSQRSEEGPVVATSDPDPIRVRTEPVSLQARFTLEEKFSGLIAARQPRDTFHD